MGKGSRIAALFALSLMVVPAVPLDLFAGRAQAQGDEEVLSGVLPNGVPWQDWEVNHVLYARKPASDPTLCPSVGAVPTTQGDRECPLFLNTTRPAQGTTYDFVTKTSLDSGSVPPNPANQPLPNTNVVFVLLNPALAHPIHVTSLSAIVYADFATEPTTCAVDVGTGRVGYHFIVRKLPSSDPFGSGQLIGDAHYDDRDEPHHGPAACPAGTDVGVPSLPPYRFSGTVFMDQPADLQVNDLLRLEVFFDRSLPAGANADYTFAYNGEQALSQLLVASDTAYQYAVWTEDGVHNRVASTIFPIPVDPATRFSVAGFFAFKDAWGGYDNVDPRGNPPSTLDSKWSMTFLAPDGNKVTMRDHTVRNASGEFQDCEGNPNDQTVCVTDSGGTSHNAPPSAKVFRLPTRPDTPGNGDVWNYTRARLAEVAPCPSDRTLPCGGEFRLQVSGGLHGNAFPAERFAHAFTIGGFGVRLQPLVVGTVSETAIHQMVAGQSTTFLLSIQNLAARADNYTLSFQLQSANPRDGWGVSFGGRPVAGANRAHLEGSNASLLKVTVTPPAGATSGSAVVRVTARSESATDQFAQVDLTAQVSSTILHNAGVFLFPEPASKDVRRGGNVLFNTTVWNRGTEPDSFSVSCIGGPNLNVESVTQRRADDSWNGTLAAGGQTIGCVDQNATRVLVVSLAPGDVGEAQVFLESNFNNTGQKPTMRVQVKAESQREAGKSDIATATANLVLQSSFKLFILTDGSSNPESPQDSAIASRLLRLGKDDPTLCPNPGVPASTTDCSGGATDREDGLLGNETSHPVAQQRLDVRYNEFALYRLTVVNDGDSEATFNARVVSIDNQTLETQGENCQPGNNRFSTFNMVSQTASTTSAMQDKRGVAMLRRPSVVGTLSDDDVIRNDGGSVTPGDSPVAPGQSAAFYLRVRNEWNRYNISLIGAAGAVGATTNQDGPICDSRSTIRVEVTSNRDPRPTAVVTAVTRTTNGPVGDPSRPLPASVVMTDGALQDNSIISTDTPQSCPPVTPEGSPDRLLCRYVPPGNATTWEFTASKFNAIRDEFLLQPITRVGGLSLTDLRNRGWIIGAPTGAGDCATSDTPASVNGDSRAQANWTSRVSGDELKLRVCVRVPRNATVSDFAGLQVQVCSQLGAPCRPIVFYTIGAQQFKVSLHALNPLAEIHPGDRAAINLNVSNEGAAVDVYNVTLVSRLPDNWGVSFQPNETRVSPSHNKTVTVFLQSPRVGITPPVTEHGAVRVRSQVNASFLRGETFAEADFTVVVKPQGPDDLRLNVTGIETRPIDSGGSLTFTLNVTNPSPNEIKVKLHRDGPAEFVDGWHDVLGESCFNLAGRTSKLVSFTVTAAPDALEGTHVTYVLRADQADNNCNLPANAQNFAQALVTATVIGRVGLELQAGPATVFPPDGVPFDDPNGAGVGVVPRGGAIRYQVIVRNIGTAGDTFFFTPTFVNQSQALGSNPWHVEMRDSQNNVVQSMPVDPQTGRVVFVNVSAPVNLPSLGVRSDIDLGVRGTGGVPSTLRLVAFVQDYDIRLRIANSTVDAIPGQTQFFVLNLTSCGVRCGGIANGIDFLDITVDIGGLSGFWNVTTEFSAVRLLNDTSKDVQISVQVPKSPLPTTGAVIGVTVRSRSAESLRPAAEQLGLGSPLIALLNSVPKTGLIQVNLFPYVSIDVDGDREQEISADRNKNAADGFEFFFDPFTGVIQAVDLLAADGDADGRVDHFVDINLDGRPDRFWAPTEGRVTVIQFHPDVNVDGTLEFLYDSDGDLAVDRWIDPTTRRSGEVIQKDFDDDGNPEFLVDTNGDGRPDRYFDADRGPRGLVTVVQQAPGGNAQQYAIDTNGGGRPTKIYDRVTGEVTTAAFSSALDFVVNFWYFIALVVIVVVGAAYVMRQRRRQAPPPEGGA
jgi:uncharacterized membrane protein